MRKKLVFAGIGIVLVAFVGAGIWWLFDSGRLVYSANPGSTNGKAIACGDDVVDRYNEVTYYALRSEDATLPTYDEDGLAKLATEIRATDGYESDATCQAMLFFVAVRNDSYEDANKSYTALLDLHEQGVYANSNIRSNEPLYNYPDFFNILSGAPAIEE